ncbi:hypothetical protein Tco_0842562 [Tanacetum coccineum]|uniref:Uncharacterized protein n=1 Tax=Tanacetum coccineum TaxID=301880 RepID=A0ABQ5AZM4_9ASTR
MKSAINKGVQFARSFVNPVELWLPSPLVGFRKRAWSIIAWMDSGVMLFRLVLLTGVFGPLLVVAVAVSDDPEDGSRVHTHNHDGSEAPDESPDSIISSEPKPLRKHRPPPPPSILSPGESSYTP